MCGSVVRNRSCATFAVHTVVGEYGSFPRRYFAALVRTIGGDAITKDFRMRSRLFFRAVVGEERRKEIIVMSTLCRVVLCRLEKGLGIYFKSIS